MAKPSKPPEVRHGITGFGVCPAEFPSCFGAVFHYYVPFPPFWNCNMYSMTLLCWKYLICFMSLQGLELRDCPETQKRL